MRIRIAEIEPKIYRWIKKLDNEIASGDISPIHQELIKIRASQLNNCGYCINAHIEAALEKGESQKRINLLSQWRNFPQLFDPREQVVLLITEEVTNIKGGLSDETYNRALELFGANELAQLIMAAVTINAWNRIGVATHMEDLVEL